MSWSDLYLTSAGLREKFEDVRLITTISEWYASVQESALTRAQRVSQFPSDQEIADQVNQILEQQAFPMTLIEFVRINEESITIGLNCTEITDDCIEHAVELLQDALGENPSRSPERSCYFPTGDRMVVNSIKQIPWLHTH